MNPNGNVRYPSSGGKRYYCPTCTKYIPIETLPEDCVTCPDCHQPLRLHPRDKRRHGKNVLHS